MTRTAIALCVVAALGAALPDPARAQSPSGGAPPERFGVQGFGMAGVSFFTASQTFDAVLDASSGPIYGGGVRVTIPGGPYLEVGAWRFNKDGERAFVTADKRVFRLGIPTTVTMTPLEITAGWRFRGLIPRLTPHVGVGFTSLRYEETSEFAEGDENVAERFKGFHLAGGVEARLARWVGLAGEVVWTSVGDALGDGGVSQVFEEDNLGGTSIRLKLILGR